MDDDVVPAAVGEFLASGRAFPSRLPAPGSGGGSELGAPVQLYATDAAPAPFPAPNHGPAGAPPVVASWPGDRVGWLLRGRRGKGDGDSAA